ncbi:MAG: glycosyltransferase family 39 protein [Pseudomonadota bacterium]
MNPRYGSWLGLLTLWLLVLLTALLTRPLLPVDETRYASVAWDMWSRGDFLVPYLNGEPYSHKPPLYFWLIHAGWWLFGVHEWVLRCIAPVIALLILFATANLSRQLWPGDTDSARRVPWLVFGSIFFTAFITWVQIDLLLVLMTLLAMTGIIRAAHGMQSGWLFTGIAIGLGVLSKGPVILLHVLPVALLAPLWKRDADTRFWLRWYAGMVGSVLVGAVIALAWALPAAQAGGEVYREAILWGQTANRMVQSFAHAHPPWWYFPWLAVLFAPWILLPWCWSALRRAGVSKDEGLRFCLTWLVSVFVLMSLVSGKQIKYLLPLVPAFALLLGRVLSRMDDRMILQRPWLPGGVLFVAGGLLVILPFVMDAAAWIKNIHPLWGVLLMVVAVVLLLQRPLQAADYPQRLTLFSVLVIMMLHFGVFKTAAPAYDMQSASRVIASAQAAGHEVAMQLGYHGQFGFTGRLTQPIVQLEAGQAPVWAEHHQQGYLVVITRSALEEYPKAVFTQPYRSGYLAIYPGEAVANNPAVLH